MVRRADPCSKIRAGGFDSIFQEESSQRKSGVYGRFFRICLRGCTLLEPAGVALLRLYCGQRQACWVGLETPAGASWSFYWDPSKTPTGSLLLDRLHPGLKLLIEFTLAGIWRDLCLSGERAFPFDNAGGRQARVTARLWGSEGDGYTISHQVDHTVAGAMSEFEPADLSSAGVDMVQSAVDRLDPPVDARGLARLWPGWNGSDKPRMQIVFNSRLVNDGGIIDAPGLRE